MAILDVSNLKLFERKGTELADFFSKIEYFVHEIDFSGNDLWRMNPVDLMFVLYNLPKTVSSINLSGNGLNYKNGTELVTIFSGIHEEVSAANFSSNSLYKAELSVFLVALPKTISTLNLSDNEFYRNSTRELVKNFTALPRNIVDLTLSFKDIEMRTEVELMLLAQKLIFVEQIEFVDDNGKNVDHPSVRLLKQFISDIKDRNESRVSVRGLRFYADAEPVVEVDQNPILDFTRATLP